MLETGLRVIASVSYVYRVKFAFELGTKPNGSLPLISLEVFQGVSHSVFLWDLLQEVLALGCQHSSCSRLPIVSFLHGLGLDPHGDITSKHALGPFHVDMC